MVTHKRWIAIVNERRGRNHGKLKTIQFNDVITYQNDRVELLDIVNLVFFWPFLLHNFFIPMLYELLCLYWREKEFGLVTKTKMAEFSWNLYDEENFDDLEDEDESNNWTEIFSAPENECRGFGCHKNNNTSSRESLEKEANSNTDDSQKTKEVVEKNDCKSTDISTKRLTRMELNDHKAGMVGLDKQKINQIIFKASKGSKFYENELKKEKQVAERIAKQTVCLEKLTQQQRREAAEATDVIVKELEQTRDLSRTFVHIDMDAFYAAVEILDNPELRDKPMAVGSNAMLSTSNYPARRYGVRAAMPGFIAKKLCPELVILPAHFDKYKEYSRQVQEILAEYDPNFAMASLDEAYLDLTEHLNDRQKNDEKKRFVRSKSQAEPRLENEKDQGFVEEIVEFGNDAEEAVRELRFRIEQKTRLTASAGIAPNVMLAKVCSDHNKPNGQFLLEPDRDVVLEFVHNLPIRKISGIGRVSEQMLKALGIETCKDLYTKRDLLYLLHSPISFTFLTEVSLGLGSTSIATDSKRKSIGTETTFSEMSKPEELLEMCDKMCQSLAQDMKGHKLKGKTVTIKLKTVNFEIKSRSLSPLNPVSTYEEIVLAAKELLKNEINACFPHPLKLRLMGVRLSNFQNITSDSSKETKQNTITGFLKQKQNFPCMEAPGSFIPTQQFHPDEHSSLAPPGLDFSKENNFMAEAFVSRMTDQDHSSAAHHLSSENSLSKKASPLSGPVSSSISSDALKNCAETLQDKTANPSPLFCPVCGQDQVLKPGVDVMIELNKHIDLCLNKATIREIVSGDNSERSSACESIVCHSDSRTGVETGSSRGKRKRKHSGTPSKKVTLHSFWSK